MVLVMTDQMRNRIIAFVLLAFALGYTLGVLVGCSPPAANYVYSPPGQAVPPTQPAPLTIVTTSCPSVVVGVPYTCQLVATGGTPGSGAVPAIFPDPFHPVIQHRTTETAQLRNGR